MIDVLIVGGGPAGAITALAVARGGASACVVENSRPDKARVGEHLPPRASFALGELGVADVLLRSGAIASPGIRTVWGSAAVHQKDYLFNPYGSGFNLERRQFDALLLEGARAAGATVRLDTRVRAVERASDGWRVVIASDGSETVVHARVLVDATGRSAVVARRLGAVREGMDRLVGIVSRYECDADHPDSTLLVEAAPTGWWYSLPLPGHQLLAVFMTDAARLKERPWRSPVAWQQVIDAVPHTAERVAELRSAAPPIVRAADCAQTLPAAGAGWIAVGDAAVSLDPLSSDGIAHAVESGLAAATVIRRDLQGDHAAFGEYAARQHDVFARHRAERLNVYRDEIRWPEEPFWRCRQMDHGQICLAPDDLLVVRWTRARLAPTIPLEIEMSSRVCQLCRRPARAHTVVAAVRDEYREVADEQVILMLQRLITQGVLELR